MSSYFLNSIIILFVFLTQFFYNDFNLEASEGSILEITQLCVIFLGIIFTLKYKKFLIKLSTKFAYYLKVLFLSAIFYEEISYLTRNMMDFFNYNNRLSEINIHNLSILSENGFLNITIPFLNYSCNIYYIVIIYSIIFLFLGYGSYLPYLKKLRVLLLEKKYSFYSFLYIFVIISNSISKNYFMNNHPIISAELVELFIYMLFLIDTFAKINIVKSKTV